MERYFSREDKHPFDEVTWEIRSTSINGSKGEVLFHQDNIEIPSFYSELATRIVASKYFYGDADFGRNPSTGGREHSLKQLIGRVTNTIAKFGLEDGYFASEKDAKIFEEELTYLCVNQMGAFNSPVWFNVGLYHAYGAGKNSAKGNYFWNSKTEQVEEAPNQYEYPQGSACFIQSVDDSLDDIMRLAVSEAKLFKFGSGSGTDLTPIRSMREKLAGGGRASGPLSFLEVYDSVAGVVKSGGKTRRAAKMNVLKDWHPDIEEFIEAKSIEERKVWALIAQGYSSDFNGPAYGSVRFQNENLSIRTSDSFMEAAIAKKDWWTRQVTDGQPCEKKNAGDLLKKISEGTHLCGDPGLQFDDTINDWHTCLGTARQNCTNPCSEYLFLDDTACNLASLNLLKFYENEEFNCEKFAKAVRVFIIAQEIIVDRASYPTEAITYNSHWFRTLGLGYANLGSLLMHMGLGYDSEAGRSLAAGITAIMTGQSYLASAELAKMKGPFAGYLDARAWGVKEPLEKDNIRAMHRVIKKHEAAVSEISKLCPEKIRKFAQESWKVAREMGEAHGYRNAQVTVLAPTGTIGFMMDCDTTGVEPAIGLIAYKQLAGGGFLTMPLQCVTPGLKKLGYNSVEIERVLAHIEQFGTIEPVEFEGKIHESGIKAEHIHVFDTAFVSGRGTRSLHYRGHILMMSAVQPFISGGISKTVNMPNSATVEEIEKTYIEAWKLGIKGIAIYRDGSKGSAPLTTKKEDAKAEKAGEEKQVQIVIEPYRRRLPDTRQSITHKFSVGGTEGYITVGMYDDGGPGEVFIQMNKAGSTINGLMDSIGILFSCSLQYGVPLEDLVKKFVHVRFEPEGFTKNPEIGMAKSVMDYLARWLGMQFIAGYRERHSKLSNGSAHKIQEDVEKSGEEEKPNPNQIEMTLTEEGSRICPECGSSKVKITGTCAACLNCGTSLGCS